MLTFLAIIGGAVVLAVLIILAGWNSFGVAFLNWYADFDTWWSCLRALAGEGEMYITVKGNPQGPFADVLPSIPTHVYDRETDTFKKIDDDKMHEPKGYLARNGLVYVGFNRYLLMREVRYDKYEKMEGSTDFGLKEKVRPGPSIYFQYNMATMLDHVETMGNIVVSMIISFTVQVFGPRRAFFLAGGWEADVNAGVQGVMRQYGGSKTVDNLRMDKNTGGSTELIRLLTGTDPDCLNPQLAQIGVVIIRAKFIDFDVVEDPETAKAVKAKQVATLEGDAAIERASKENEAATLRAEAIRKIQTARIESGKDQAGMLALTEVLPETDISTLVLGNAPISLPVGK